MLKLKGSELHMRTLFDDHDLYEPDTTYEDVFLDDEDVADGELCCFLGTKEELEDIIKDW